MIDWHQLLCKIDFSKKKILQNTFQVLHPSDAIGPEHKSRMDKVKEKYPKSNFYHLKVINLQDMCKTERPSGSVLKCIPKCLHKSPGACHILKININILSLWHVACVSVLYSISTNKNENTYHIRCLLTWRRHLIQ